MDFEKGLSTFSSDSDVFRRENIMLYILRRDGVVVATSSGKGMAGMTDHQSVGALSGGVWQAARALAEIVDHDDTDEIYRFSFDTSSRGIYLLPLNEFSGDYVLGCLFRDSMNPGQLKNELRKLRAFVSENCSEVAKIKGKAEKPLFNNITDEEMDNLFSFAGN